MNEYMGFWHRFPLEERIFNTLFNPKYKDTLIPIYKPNNVKYPELNLGVLVGLWKTGQVNNWGVGAYADIWKWAAEHYGAPGDVIMRLMVMSISMGGNYFVLARNVLEESKEYLDLADGYKRYFQTLYHLIRSDVLRPVENQNYVLLSPFAIHERPDLKEIRSRSAGTQIYWQNAYGMKGPLDGGFFLQSVRKNYLIQSFYPYMLSYYDGLFPKTPYGYIAILPAVMEPIKTGFFCDYWVVDGDGLYDKNGKRVGIEQLPTVIQNCLGELKNRLPVMTPDAFLISHKTPEGYKVYLINPYVFEAKDVKARVTVHIRNGKIRITDGITGYPISFGGNTLEIVIPAGLFRIINITHE